MLLWACGLTLLGTLLGFFKAVAAGLDGQYFAAMNESVDEGDDTGGVGGDRNGPRKLDSALSEIFLRFQATNLTLA